MSHVHAANEPIRRSASQRPNAAATIKTAAFILFLCTLAWAPFPLGSNRPWSWSLLVLLVTACWFVWAVSVWSAPQELRSLRLLLVPSALAGAAIAWALIQALPWVPAAWVHPVWQLGQDVLNRPLHGSISLDPWRTVTEAMMLGSYVAAAALTYKMTEKAEWSQRLLDVLIVVGAFYAVYALALASSGFTQENIFYAGSTGGPFGGPFVSKNNFATYAGLAALCAGVRLFDLGGRTLIIGRGGRQFTVSAIHFIFGIGALPLAAFILTFAALVATGSRAGFIAFLSGMTVLMAFSGILAGSKRTRGWALIGFAAIAVLMASLFMIAGDSLESRFNTLVEAGGIDETRALLWDSAIRMISDAPWLGLGFGTFEQAYPLYADRVLPFVLDKAHNDYLEFAAGIGIPAAIAWCSALLWLAAMCLRGVFVRRRDRHYSMLALAATMLVGVHSFFDFSLQIPAIALTYAAILGLGVSQSFPTRQREME